MIPLTINSDDAAIVFLVADVEELVVLEPVLAARRDVRLDVVQLAEQPRELDVPLVVEIRVPEDQYAVLDRDGVVRKDLRCLGGVQEDVHPKTCGATAGE